MKNTEVIKTKDLANSARIDYITYNYTQLLYNYVYILQTRMRGPTI